MLNRQQRLERHQKLIALDMPPGLAADFTTSQKAVLCMIAEAVRQHGDCNLPNTEIAAYAGVGEDTVRETIRLAAARGLVSTQEQASLGWRRHFSPVVRIVSAEWLRWIGRGQEGTEAPAAG
jgi:hypothetical protein